jgi:uncharacterized protein
MEVNRNIYKGLAAEFSRPEISILLGSRQVGKTFLLKKLAFEARKRGLKVRYYNLEIPNDLMEFNRDDMALFEFMTQDVDVLFIDEFHYLKNASHLFKAIYDSDKDVKIFASGSSSIEIHKHLKESLAGRRLVSYIYPLEFNEYQQLPTPSDQLINNYLLFGGLPGLIHISDHNEKIRMLGELYATYIQKDIKSLLKEENIRAFNMLLYLLATYQGSLISVNNIASEIGLTARTVEKYITLLEQTFVIYSIGSYSRNIANELKKSRKMYFYDLGIRNSILKNFATVPNRPDTGSITETFVLLQIIPSLRINMELKFWRDKAKNEIDFVLLRDNKPIIIEVKTNLNLAYVPKAFSIFMAHYPETEFGIVCSLNFEGELVHDGKTIYFIKLENLMERLKQ